jgi:hypothetical protein
MHVIKVRGAEDRVFVLEEGKLDHAALTAFVGGQCHGLALAIHEETGWPLIGVDDSDGMCEHICVRREDGRLVDVTGAHTEAEMCGCRGRSLREIGPADIDMLVADNQWAPADPGAAQPWVGPVLERSASGPHLPPMASDTFRKIVPAASGPLRLRFEWGGGTEMKVYVGRVGSEDWVLHDEVPVSRDAETGDYLIEFSVPEFERMIEEWLKAHAG